MGSRVGAACANIGIFLEFCAAKELIPGTKWPGRDTDHSHPEPILRMTIPPVLHIRVECTGILQSRAFHSQPHSSSLLAKGATFLCV